MNLINKPLVWLSFCILILGMVSCAKRSDERYRIVSTEGKYLISVWNARSLKYAQLLVNKVINASNGGTYEIPVNEPKKTSVEPIDLVPTNDEIAGWKRVEPIMTYVGDEIFKDRLYGERDLFLSFNFLKQASVDYENPGLGREPLLRLDIYDMGTSEDAFGIYSVNRFSKAKYDPWIGDESIVNTKRFYLWKGRYYVEIEAFEYADDIHEGMINLAKAVDRKIKSNGKFPELLKLLPEERRIRRSEKYFHEFVALKKIDASVDKANTLNLSDGVSGVIAQYKHKESAKLVLDTVKLLLIKYPHQKLAESAYKSYTESLQQDSSLVIESYSSKSVIFKKIDSTQIRKER